MADPLGTGVPAAASARVAIVHDWLTLTGGAERVLKVILDLYPDADIFCIVCFLKSEDQHLVKGRKVTTSFIQRLPFARKRYRSYLPLMPLAVEQFDLSGYDLVISSSHAVAKGVITGPEQLHVSYVHSPIRYAWDMQHTYLREVGLERGPKSFIARVILHYMRLWDSRTANGVDHFITNSGFIQKRIAKVYRRKSTVLYPPIDTASFTFSDRKEDFYLTASRMVPYKMIPLIARAFAAMPDRKLVIVGDGPEMSLVKAAAGPNVSIVGRQSEAALVDYMQRAKAFVFAAEEDFGIVPLEAQACGTPVIAYGRGGSLETVVDNGPGRTGIFFDRQTPEALVDAVRAFEALAQPIDPAACRRQAERFGTAAFKSAFGALVDEQLIAAANPSTVALPA